MLRSLGDDFLAALDTEELPENPGDFTIATGVAAAPFLRGLLEQAQAEARVREGRLVGAPPAQHARARRQRQRDAPDRERLALDGRAHRGLARAAKVLAALGPPPPHARDPRREPRARARVRHRRAEAVQRLREDQVRHRRRQRRVRRVHHRLPAPLRVHALRPLDHVPRRRRPRKRTRGDVVSIRS